MCFFGDSKAILVMMKIKCHILCPGIPAGVLGPEFGVAGRLWSPGACLSVPASVLLAMRFYC